jgi:hypothetical protein
MSSIINIEYCVNTAPVRPFKLTFRTDNTEAAVVVNAPTAPVAATADVGITGVNGNTGFCLDFQER